MHKHIVVVVEADNMVWLSVNIHLQNAPRNSLESKARSYLGVYADAGHMLSVKPFTVKKVEVLAVNKHTARVELAQKYSAEGRSVMMRGFAVE